MRVLPVPLLADNYGYLLNDGGSAVVIDPSDAEPVLRRAEVDGLQIEAIWITHHHWDHVGGIGELRKRLGPIPVLGSAYDLERGRIEGQGRGLGDGERFRWGPHDVEILSVPGHTLGAIAYLVGDDLFTGDTLFLAGCGRLFEGTPEMMAASLRRLADLPPSTRIWCGHEYTTRNLEFASTVEPDNRAIEGARRRASELRAKGLPTVPWTLEEDCAVNPFLRFDRPSIAGGRTPVESFAALRKAKDQF